MMQTSAPSQRRNHTDWCSPDFSSSAIVILTFMVLGEIAVQLDRMNKGAKISSVAGSSVGAVGGVLSIIGLALIPVTAGVSLALTMTGVGLGITSGVNSVVTTATEVGVNVTQQKKASEVLKLFMEDVQSLQDCLEEVTNRETSEITVVVEVSKVLCKAGVVGKNIDALVDVASAAKLLQSEELITGVDIGQAAVKGPLALSKSARASLIAVNALFLGMDIFFICKDSISLAKGSETEVSRFIRARAALWSSEIDSWQRIHDSLCQGLISHWVTARSGLDGGSVKDNTLTWWCKFLISKHVDWIWT
uniref:Apolipoprotein L n=1 Tax=Seriola dumerili TaxID=41447 RepID=A0A3B4VGB7_SERDU